MTAPVIHEATRVRTTLSAPASGRIREAFHHIHLAVQEMNYASRRVMELQAPWTVDKQWYRK
ncbi:MAG: hypothetical protein ACRDN0_38800 [Trebonia sp.]